VHLARGRVDRQVAELARRSVGAGGLRAARAAQHRLDPGHQLTGAERLGQVVVRADRQPDELVHFLGPGGQHDDVGVGERAQRPADLHAVDARQHQVQDHHVGRPRAGKLQGAFPVQGDLSGEPFPAQVVGDQPGQVLLVIDHKGAQRPGAACLGHRPAPSAWIDRAAPVVPASWTMLAR
jgi:hypothetical protein